MVNMVGYTICIKFTLDYLPHIVRPSNTPAKVITIQYIVESIPHGLIVVESVEKKEKRKRAKRKDVLCFVSLFYHYSALLFPVAQVLKCHSNHAQSRYAKLFNTKSLNTQKWYFELQ